MHQQFDFYNGGGLDICFLGMAEVTQTGDVNVTRVGNTLTGPGGFIDISQCTQRVYFMGTFTASGLETSINEKGELSIVREGRIKKFIRKIPEISFSADEARKKGQVVKYITERCVFSLTRNGLSLTEVAPGIDIQRDILDHMEFQPAIPREPRTMNPLIFRNERMGLADSLRRIDMKSRIFYVEATNTIFIDLSAVHVHDERDIQHIMQSIAEFFDRVAPNGRAHTEVNYYGFHIAPELYLPYQAAASALEAAHYVSVRRHTGRTFNHLKSAAPPHEVPDELSFEELRTYCHRHHFSVADEHLADLFHHVGEGTKTINREQCTRIVQKLSAEGSKLLPYRSERHSGGANTG
jgi:propionate CoA-transferase